MIRQKGNERQSFVYFVTLLSDQKINCSLSQSKLLLVTKQAAPCRKINCSLSQNKSFHSYGCLLTQKVPPVREHISSVIMTLTQLSCCPPPCCLPAAHAVYAVFTILGFVFLNIWINSSLGSKTNKDFCPSWVKIP